VAITKSAPGVASATRTVATAYFAGRAEVQSVTTEPDEPATSSLKLTTTFTRDAVYGVLQKKTLAWYDPVSASALARDVEVLSGYDARMRWAQQLRNARGHLETHSYDEASGNPLSLTGPNQLSTTWQYDGWGRKTREDRADGSATTWAYRRCSDTCLNQAATVAVTQGWTGAAQTGVPAESFADRLGRTVLTRSWAFDGSPVLTEQVYSAAGRLVQASRPRFA
jgi:YD repeat-containing protein